MYLQDQNGKFLLPGEYIIASMLQKDELWDKLSDVFGETAADKIDSLAPEQLVGQVELIDGIYYNEWASEEPRTSAAIVKGVLYAEWKRIEAIPDTRVIPIRGIPATMISGKPN